MSVLAIERLSVRYGARIVLDDVSLQVAAGEIVALVGPSGSGKSTLAAAALALLPPSARATGTVRIGGADLAAMDEARLGEVRGGGVGMVFQDPASALNPALTIGRQIGETIARHQRLGRAAIAAEVRALLARVGLDVPPDRYPHTLSGGQRQRVCVAIAIAAGPALLIADEPTAALDPIAQAGIVALLAGLARERGMALLLVSHDLALVAGIADRLAVLDGGRVVEHGPARLLLDRPGSAVLADMVAASRTPLAVRPPPAGAPLLRVAGVTRSYPVGGLLGRRRFTALDGVDLEVARGETLAVVGESGSGKSTLARLVLGLDMPDRGEITLDGMPWRGAPRALRRQAQAVFQDPAASFDPLQSVARIVAEPLHLLDRRPSPGERDRLVVEALAHVGLPAEAAVLRPAHFSGGQRQRIALARALILSPALVVLDEALSALDMTLRAEIVALLVRLQAELGLAFLFISHDLRLVRGFADRVLVLRRGRVIEHGPAEQVLTRPRDPYTAALIAASPDPG